MVIEPRTLNSNIPFSAYLISWAYNKITEVTFLGTSNDDDELLLEEWYFEHEQYKNFQIALGTSDMGRRAIILPGTNECVDWKDNLSVIPRTYIGPDLTAEWHSGSFKGSLGLFKNIIEPFILSTEGPILLTGHSLGGMLIGEIAYLLAENKYDKNVEYVISWASPRFTNSIGRDYLEFKYKDRAVRMVAGFDIVPHFIPPGIFFLRYRHTWPLIHIGTDGLLRDKFSIKTKLYELWGAIKSRGFQLVAHHFSDYYLKWASNLIRSMSY